MLQKKMFRLVLCLFLVSSVTISVCQAADDKPMDLVKKGVKYLGGAKNLKKFNAITMEEKGVFYGMGEGMEYIGKTSMLGSRKFKMEIVGVFSQVFDGKKGWIQQGGQVIEMNEAQVKSMNSQMYAGKVMQMYSLLNGKYALSFDGKAEINGKKAVIVKVKKQGQKEVRLFLDPSSGALVKSEHYGPMDDMIDNIVKYETFYSDYKTSGKLKYATKFRMTRDGKKFIVSTITSYKAAEKFPPRTFVKPD